MGGPGLALSSKSTSLCIFLHQAETRCISGQPTICLVRETPVNLPT
jgi:hypothetical protein